MNKKENHIEILNSIPDGIDIAESPGFKLRKAREAAGVHIGALAASLKVPVSKLEALENNDFSLLPDAVFARALASSVCRTLGLEVTSVLELMPKNDVSSFSKATPQINRPFKEAPRKLGPNSLFGQVIRPRNMAVVILLLAALALGLIPFERFFSINKNDSAEMGVSIAEPEFTDTTKSIPKESVVSSDVIADEATTAPVVSDALPTDSKDAFSENITSNSSIPLELRARGESWVQVRDATKAVIFERTLTKGESAVPKGNLPFAVVIGRADLTEVLLQGKVFDLAEVAKDNVARFEVKQ